MEVKLTDMEKKNLNYIIIYIILYTIKMFQTYILIFA